MLLNFAALITFPHLPVASVAVPSDGTYPKSPSYHSAPTFHPAIAPAFVFQTITPLALASFILSNRLYRLE